jgi:hypothetical protein
VARSESGSGRGEHCAPARAVADVAPIATKKVNRVRNSSYHYTLKWLEAGSQLARSTWWFGRKLLFRLSVVHTHTTTTTTTTTPTVIKGSMLFIEDKK